MVAGRAFRPEDHTRPVGVAIVNEAFAKSVRGARAVGQMLRVAAGRDGEYETGIDVTIVGLVRSFPTKPHSLPTIYLPAGVTYQPARTLMLRYRGPAGDAAETLQQVVRQIDPRVPIRELTTALGQTTSLDGERALMARGVAILGVLALILAAMGVYGVISYIVSLRTQEIGVRMALGAQPGQILRMVLRQGLVPTSIGCLLGAGGAAALGAIVRSRLYGTSPVDPLAFALAAAVLLAVMLLASALPAAPRASIQSWPFGRNRLPTETADRDCRPGLPTETADRDGRPRPTTR